MAGKKKVTFAFEYQYNKSGSDEIILEKIVFMIKKEVEYYDHAIITRKKY